jgi:putative ABC transport system substrate-binding protein
MADTDMADPAAVREVVSRLVTDPPALVLPLGVAAIRAVGEVRSVPIVATMALRPGGIPRAANVTGVALEFPPEVYVEWLRRALPKARSAAVLHNPAENAAAVAEVRRAAERHGIHVDLLPVPTPKDIPRALERASGVDVLLGLADGVVYTPESARGILLFSFRNRVPLVGLPGTWVQAGALFGLDRDYEDIGRQAGEMAARILKGASPGSLPVATPRRVCPVANLATAERMGIALGKEALAGACAAR